MCKLFVPPFKDSDVSSHSTTTNNNDRHSLYSFHTSTTCIAMSALLAGYESSDDEAAPTAPVASTSASTSTKRPDVPATGDDDDESDDERLEAQARTDAFGLNETNTNGSTSQTRTKDGKVVVASAPDVLREVRLCYNEEDDGRTNVR